MFEQDIIIRCLKCGRKNRIPAQRIHDRPLCGVCGFRLDELLIQCLACGAKNRVPEERINERPVCGICGKPLYQGDSTPVTDNTFSQEVVSFPGPVLVCFWAPWCIASRIALPIFEHLAPQYAGGIKFAKVNTDDCPALTSKYAIKNTPAFLFFNGGNLSEKIIGSITQKQLEEHLRAILRKNGK